MVNVPHNRDHRRPWQQIFGFIFFNKILLNITVGNPFELMSKLFNNNLSRIGINGLINGCHDTKRHQFFNNIGTLFGHTVCQFLNRNNLRNHNLANNFFLRLLRLLNRFRLFLFKSSSWCPKTIIVIVVITYGINIIDINFSTITTLWLKRAFGNFLPILFKTIFFSGRFFRFAIFKIIILVIIIKIPGFFLFCLEIRTIVLFLNRLSNILISFSLLLFFLFLHL